MSQPTPPSPSSGLASRLRSNTFLKHVLTLMTGTAVSQLLVILARPVLSRQYTDEQWGTYQLVLALASGLMTIGALRYDNAVVMPARDSDARALVRLSSRLALGTSLLVCVVMTIWAHDIARVFQNPQLGVYLPYVGLLVLAMTQISNRQFWLNRRKRYKEMARNRMGLSATMVTTQFAAALAGLGAMGLLLGSLVGQWFSALNLWRLTRRETEPQPGDSMRAVAVEYKKMPLLNGPNAVVDQIRLQGINLMIAMFFGLAQVGQFTMAWQLLQMPMGLINGALSQVFYQKLATTRRGQMFAVAWRAMLRSFVVGFIPFLLIWLLAPWIFPLALGNKGGHDWTMAGQIAQMLVPWLYINFVTSPMANVFLTTRRQGVMFVFACFYMAVPLSLIWFFHGSIVQTMAYVSWSMAALLVIFLLLVLMVSRQYDRGMGLRPGEGDGSEVMPEQAAAEAAANDDVK